MSEHHMLGPSPPVPPDDGGDIGELLRLAGPRGAVPADRLRRVKTAVHAEWRHQTRARKHRRAVRWSLVAAAAAALMLLAIRVADRGGIGAPDPASVVATVDVVSGAVRLLPASGRRAEPVLLHVGEPVRAGDEVDATSGGRAALRLAGGASVRIDRGTRLRLLSAGAMALDEGVVYIDSGGDPAASLEVRTRLGVVRDIGTRFEVRIGESALRVRVRDGLVRLSQSRASHDAGPGDELTVDGTGDITRRAIPVFGTDWAWTTRLARPFELEGRPLREFLDWIAAENGWQLRFADADVEQKAQTTILHGSIDGLTPDEALAAVLPASGVNHQLEDGVLQVRLTTGTLRD